LVASSESQLRSFDVHDKRIVVQLQVTSRFVEAACFPSPSGRKVFQALDMTHFLNALMFLCASKRGLSQVVMAVLNLEASALRVRPVPQLRAGPDKKQGFFVGLTFLEACAAASWEHAVLVGIVNSSVLYSKQERLAGSGGEIIGMLPQPDYVIRDSDYAVFISPDSFPIVSTRPQDRPSYHKKVLAELASPSASGHAGRGIRASFFVAKGSDQDAQLVAARERSGGAPLDLTPLAFHTIESELKTKQKVLVAGWRPVWSLEPSRLRSRLHDIARSAAKGSYVCFLNQMDTDGPNSFSERVEGVGEPLPPNERRPEGWAKGWSLPGFPNLKVYHRKGNASREGDLEPILRDPTALQVAIVLGSQQGVDLLPSSMDTRVLSIMLILKHMTAAWPVKLHVISENQLDQTADVAVTPGGATFDPDFVNTQAFTARCLVVALAYPRLQPALAEMFEDDIGSSDGSPEFDIIPCSFLALGGRCLPFGIVQQIVSAKFGGWAVAVGTMTANGLLTMTPGVGYAQAWADDDRLVILRRKFLNQELYNERALKKGKLHEGNHGKHEHSPKKASKAAKKKKKKGKGSDSDESIKSNSDDEDSGDSGSSSGDSSSDDKSKSSKKKPKSKSKSPKKKPPPKREEPAASPRARDGLFGGGHGHVTESEPVDASELMSSKHAKEKRSKKSHHGGSDEEHSEDEPRGRHHKSTSSNHRHSKKSSSSHGSANHAPDGFL
jgi:hypothetical protein